MDSSCGDRSRQQRGARSGGAFRGRVLDLLDIVTVNSAVDIGQLAEGLNKAGKNFFRWEGKTYGEADDGLFVAMPNPWNSSKVVYMFLGNSVLQVYQMTKRFQGLPSWGVWKGDQVTDRGYFSPYYPAAGLPPDITTSLR